MLKKYWLLILILSLLLLLIPACGDDDEEEITAGTPTPTVMPKLEPIKIGILEDFSGPGAAAGWLADGCIGLMKWQLEKEGGLLVSGIRRPVEFIKYDMKGETAVASSGARKLILDKVSAIVYGGWLPPHGLAVADVSDPAKVAYFDCFSTEENYKPYKWVMNIGVPESASYMARTEKVVMEVVKPKTVAYFGSAMDRDRTLMIKKGLEALGVDTVYAQDHAVGVVDFLPYLTKIKYTNPDCLILNSDQTSCATMYKQIMELGGWGNIKVVGVTEAAAYDAAVRQRGAVGIYVPIMYLPGMTDTPAVKAFEEAWVQKAKEDPGWAKTYSSGSTLPTPNHAIMYEGIQAALETIKQAGTDDPGAIAEMGRSGKVEFDSPIGHIHFQPDGSAGITGYYVQVQEEGKMVPVTSAP